MSSRGGINSLNKEVPKSAKKPVFTKIVKESLKSIILSGESELDKFVSHRALYLLGFLTGWNTKIISLELIPTIYFIIWTIVLFSLGEVKFALLFLVTTVIIVCYFILLHTVISAWDRIRHWFIRRAIRRNGIENMTLEDIKYLLIYTRKVFGVKSDFVINENYQFNTDELKRLLLKHKRWQWLLTIFVVISLISITGIGIYGFLIDVDIIDWLVNYWYVITILSVPIIICIIGVSVAKLTIKDMINNIPANKFDEVLRILNDFELFSGK